VDIHGGGYDCYGWGWWRKIGQPCCRSDESKQNQSGGPASCRLNQSNKILIVLRWGSQDFTVSLLATLLTEVAPAYLVLIEVR